MKKIFIVGIVAVLITIPFFFLLGQHPTGEMVEKQAGKLYAEVYFSPGCGCCAEYIRYLSENGFDVKQVRTQNMNSIKNDFNIPEDMWSCHTTKVGNYFVEGHIPLEAVQKLLNEQPEIDGIAMPGMPPGSPGMSGRKIQAFIIYAITNGEVNEFIRL